MRKFQKIILIDDDEITNFINENLIYEIGISDQVETYVDAEKVLEEIIGSQQMHELPQLILLDLKMPVFDGFDFLEQYNAVSHTLTSQFKIIVLTTSENPRDIERLQHLGYEDYITKPLTKEKLLNL